MLTNIYNPFLQTLVKYATNAYAESELSELDSMTVELMVSTSRLKYPLNYSKLNHAADVKDIEQYLVELIKLSRQFNSYAE